MPQTAHFFPKADAAILLSNSADRQPLPPRPDTVGPIFDPETFDSAIAEWDSTTESCLFLKAGEKLGLILDVLRIVP